MTFSNNHKERQTILSVLLYHNQGQVLADFSLKPVYRACPAGSPWPAKPLKPQSMRLRGFGRLLDNCSVNPEITKIIDGRHVIAFQMEPRPGIVGK